jgi:hypothetical protein
MREFRQVGRLRVTIHGTAALCLQGTGTNLTYDTLSGT